MSERGFKKGDRVKVINNPDEKYGRKQRDYIGCIGVIPSNDNCDDLPDVLFDDDHVECFSVEKLKLITDEEIKKSDTFELTESFTLSIKGHTFNLAIGELNELRRVLA
jgi:hypothetical protein